MAACLTKRIEAGKKGNVAGRTVADECTEAVKDYKIERSKSINRDTPLGKQLQYQHARTTAVHIIRLPPFRSEPCMHSTFRCRCLLPKWRPAYTITCYSSSHVSSGVVQLAQCAYAVVHPHARSCLAAQACKDDVGQFCKDQSDNTTPGSLVSCLRWVPQLRSAAAAWCLDCTGRPLNGWVSIGALGSLVSSGGSLCFVGYYLLLATAGRPGVGPDNGCTTRPPFHHHRSSAVAGSAARVPGQDT